MYELNSLAAAMYAELDILCAVIILMAGIVASLYFKFIKKKVKPVIKVIGLLYIIFLLVDAFWVIGEYKRTISVSLSCFYNAVYFIALIAAAALWLIYTARRLEYKWSGSKWFLISVSIPALAICFLAASAIKTQLLFYINEQIKYDRGPMFFLFPVVNYGYMLISAALCFVRAFDKSEERETRITALVMAAYSVPILAAGLSQTVTGVNFSCLGYTVSVIILFAFKIIQMAMSHKKTIALEESERKEASSLISSLNEDYSELLLVNLTTGDEVAYRLDEDIRRRIIPDTKNVFEKASAFADSFIIPEDRQKYIDAMDIDKIREGIKNNKPYIIRYRSGFKGDLEWYETRIVHHDSEDNSEWAVFGLRNCTSEVEEAQHRAEELREIEQKKALEERYNIISILSENYTGLFYVNAGDKTVEVLATTEETRSIIDKGKYDEKYVSEAIEKFSQLYVHPDDRRFIAEINSCESLRRILSGTKQYRLVFRRKSGDDYKYCQLDIGKSENAEDEANNIAVGFTEVDAQYRSQLSKERYLAVIMGIADDFESIEYVPILENKLDDAAEQIRTSERFIREIPEIVDEPIYTKRLDLMLNKVSYGPDRDKFYDETRRETILEHLEKENVYFVNVRAEFDGKDEYFQFKFAADRNPEGKIIGFMVGIHSIDNEFKRQMELREGVEKLVGLQTEELAEKNKALYKTNEKIIALLGGLVEGRDEVSGRHIQRVKRFTNVLACAVMKNLPEYDLNMNRVNLITIVSPLHDIGKIAIPDQILNKPGKLSEEEFEIMKTHCEKGSEMLSPLADNWDEEYANACLEICFSHHERWDGSGYPRGLEADEIPISAQIVAIADCFEALTSKRPYKDAIDAEKSFEMIVNGECGAFSDKLIECLKECRDEFIEAAYLDEEFNVVTLPYRENGKIKKVFDNMHILIADDEELSREINREILEAEGGIIDTAQNGTEAVKMAKENIYDFILMDVVMPEMDGIDAIKEIRAFEKDKKLRSVPIVAITADGTGLRAEECLDAGANDCIGKPLVISELSGIIIACMKENSSAMEKKLKRTIKIANTDTLTQVKNIAAYTDKIAQLSNEIASGDLPEFAIVISDINNLKQENDTYGHDVGDIYIKNCCKILCTVFDHSPVFRIGGDEFAVVLQGRDYRNKDGLMIQMETMVKHSQNIKTSESGKASFAAGIAVYSPETDSSVSDVIKRADASMYRNKKAMTKKGRARALF